MARLLPVVAEEARSRELLDRDLGLARARRRPSARRAGRARASPARIQDARARASPSTTTSHASASVRARATLERRARSATTRAALSSTSQTSGATPRATSIRTVSAPLTPQPTTAHDDASGAAERVGREHRGGSRTQRGHRARVEHGEQASVLGVREEHEAGHGRKPASRVAGKRRHPLEQRVTAADRGHRAEVAGRIVRHVDLRRHRPFAARVRDERVPNGVVRLVRRHCPHDVGRA